MKRMAWLLALALTLIACSKEKDLEPPAELVDFTVKLNPDGLLPMTGNVPDGAPLHVIKV